MYQHQAVVICVAACGLLTGCLDTRVATRGQLLRKLNSDPPGNVQSARWITDRDFWEEFLFRIYCLHVFVKESNFQEYSDERVGNDFYS
jgi:hypothetical protein